MKKEKMDLLWVSQFYPDMTAGIIKMRDQTGGIRKQGLNKD